MNKHKGTANPAYAAAMREIRRSGAAGTHADKRTKRIRTRSAAKRISVREWE